jgi:hypothetical protein
VETHSNDERIAVLDRGWAAADDEDQGLKESVHHYASGQKTNIIDPTAAQTIITARG